MNNKKSSLAHSIDTLFVLLLFALFVTMALLVTSYCAIAYKNSAKQTDERFNKQTCINYVTAKIRANNEENKIAVTDFKGVNAICISDNFYGEEYSTYIYQYDGMIREIFANNKSDADPSAGYPLTEASALTFYYENGLFKCELTDLDNKTITFYINTVK
ncbi:MAG: DUF4860 domain-containing protein [Firmicutes bacterium]|nr:DUF4860 domain-containing protein [[Eubacterium] siraeum]MCM1488460.1 DUF4860 domain-containing protein [Bacillota bacterium]